MPGQISRGSKAMPVAIMDDDGNYLGSAANPLNVSGAGGGGGGGAVTIADGADVAQGARADAAYTDATGAASGSIVSLLKGLFSSFRTVGSSFVVIVNQLTANEGIGLSTFGRATTSGGGSGNLGVLNYGYDPVANQQKFIRADNFGTWITQRPTAGTNLSGTATTTSGGFNLAANTARHPGDVQGQNVSTVNIGFNEFGGTAAIGSAGTYTVPPGGTFVITTTAQVNFIAASGTAAITVTGV